MASSPDLPRVNVVLGGAGARMAGQVGAMAALQKHFEVQRIAAVSAGVLLGAPLAAGGDAKLFYKMAVEESMTPRFADKKTLREKFVSGGLQRIDGVGTWLDAHLKTLLKGKTTFGDLPKLDPAYAQHLAADDQSKLIVRISKDLRPGDRTKGQLWVDAAEIMVGEVISSKGNAKGVAMQKFQKADFPREASQVFGTQLSTNDLSLAKVAEATMSQPIFFGPKTDNQGPLRLRLYDGALGLRIPADIFKLKTGKADPTPIIGFAMSQPGISAAKQAENDIKMYPDAIIVRIDPYVTVNGKRTKVKVADFGVTREGRDGLFENGYAAMEQALETPHAAKVLAQAAVRTQETFGVSYDQPWPAVAPQIDIAPAAKGMAQSI